jgi:hypothetical protein
MDVHLHFLYASLARTGTTSLTYTAALLFVFPRSESMIIPESSLVVHLLNVYCTMSSHVCNTLHELHAFSNTKLHFLRVCITSQAAGSELLWAEGNFTVGQKYHGKVGPLCVDKDASLLEVVLCRPAHCFALRLTAIQYFKTSETNRSLTLRYVSETLHLLCYPFFVSWRCQVRISDRETAHPVAKSSTVFVTCFRFINRIRLKLLHSSLFLNRFLNP